MDAAGGRPIRPSDQDWQNSGEPPPWRILQHVASTIWLDLADQITDRLRLLIGGETEGLHAAMTGSRVVSPSSQIYRVRGEVTNG